MPANHNGESNGSLKIRWKTLTFIAGLIVAVSTIGGYAFSYVRSATEIEMRCTAAEKRIVEHDAALREMSKQLSQLKSGMDVANTHLEWIKKNIEKRHS